MAEAGRRTLPFRSELRPAIAAMALVAALGFGGAVEAKDPTAEAAAAAGRSQYVGPGSCNASA